MKERHVALSAQIAELESERSALASGVESSLLARYDRLFDKKAPAVVPLQHGICGGCHMRVTPTTFTQVKGEKGLAFCENCSRLLYFGAD
jgi:predicted  nucleic acid-binding Zn-ribbon protein